MASFTSSFGAIGWKAGISWDYQMACQHVAFVLWWIQDSQTSFWQLTASRKSVTKQQQQQRMRDAHFLR